MTSCNEYESDVLIIGSGAAGLATALKLNSKLQVHLLSKGAFTAANTFYAQGGVAAVLDQSDSMDSHVSDTLIAGAGLCHRDAVEFTVEKGPSAIRWLQDQGVHFSQCSDANQTTKGDSSKISDGEQGIGLHRDQSPNPSSTPHLHLTPRLHLTREGGHSHRRIIHAADATGLAISRSLINQVKDRKNITGLPYRTAVDLITTQKLKCSIPQQSSHHCLGAYVFNQQTNRVEVFRSRCVILATGGASKAYLYTSNPDIATGDGIAMSWRAGCRVANMEFNQFHPTCLYHPDAPAFLISEAIRGEGGRLLLPNGEPFMQRFHEKAELAPRDIVARAIDHEMKRLGAVHLLLDISHRPSEFIQSHFPNIYQKCFSLGIDITKDPIPVVPAAHYTCGGVITNLQGETDTPRLFAIGETAFTGLHGANRMASNSLLECLAFAFSASDHINANIDQWQAPPPVPAWDDSRVTNSDEDVVISHNWDELRRFMWDYVGIVRTDKRLARAKHRIEVLKREIQEYYSNYRISNNLIELRNLVLVSDLIIKCAMQRKESRGLHFTLDYPNQSEQACDTLLSPQISPQQKHNR